MANYIKVNGSILEIKDWYAKVNGLWKAATDLYTKVNGEWKSVGKKYDYEVKYIESTGTQYIDTGIKLTDSYQIEMQFEAPTAQQKDYGRLTGVGNNETADYQYCNIEVKQATLSNLNLANRDTSSSSNYTITLGSGVNTIVFGATSSSITLTHNGTVKSAISSPATWSKASAGNLYIFCTNKVLDENGSVITSTADGFTSYKLHSYKITLGGNIVRDFVPVVKKGIGYLYDKVSKKLFGNQGTGSFLFGAKSDLPYDCAIEYLQSSGTQLIDTGVTGGTDAEYEVECGFLTQTVNYAQFFGSVQPSKQAGSPKLYLGGAKSTKTLVVEYATGELTLFDYNTTTTYKFEYKDGKFYSNQSLTQYDVGTYGFGNLNFCIFGYYPEPNLKSSMKLYACKLWLDGDLVRDMIPVRIGTVGYMYDKVNGVLYGNAGSGSFTLGSDIIEV